MSVKFVVGLTGGIGSGKSTVARAFVSLGAGLVDTDALARELTVAGGAGIPVLLEQFGRDVLAADGSMDRAAMRQRVFADPLAREQLELILHPLIRQAAREQITGMDAPYVLLDIPLLVETGPRHYDLDRILVVDCPEIVQVERVMARNGLSEPEVRAIMATQAARAVRLAIADDVIDNDRPMEKVLDSVRILHQDYLERAEKRKLQKKVL